MGQEPLSKEVAQQTVDLVREHKNVAAAARAVGIAENTMRHRYQRAKQMFDIDWRGARPDPKGQSMTKTTVQYDAQGNVLQEWRRLAPDAKAVEEFVEDLCAKVKAKGSAPKRKARKTDSSDLLYEIDIFDPHVGMYADERETLDKDYDCDIAARKMTAAVEDLASRAQRPKKCVLVFGGDSLHSDNRNNKTELSGNVLDVDTRYQRVISYLIAASRECVKIAASIAEEVELVILKGNHSWHSDCWLAQVLSAYYCECDNVTVRIDHSPRSAMTWGDNLIVWAHGDRIPAQKWPNIIAAEFSKEWGATKHRYLRCGHIHSQKTIAPVIVQEQAGIIVEFCPALCPSDAWHADSGYVGNQRGASAVEYHKSKGRISSQFYVD